MNLLFLFFSFSFSFSSSFLTADTSIINLVGCCVRGRHRKRTSLLYLTSPSARNSCATMTGEEWSSGLRWSTGKSSFWCCSLNLHCHKPDSNTHKYHTDCLLHSVLNKARPPEWALHPHSVLLLIRMSTSFSLSALAYYSDIQVKTCYSVPPMKCKNAQEDDGP